jgi:hypothetical protein
MASRRITRIKSVRPDGSNCPDGDTCPTQWGTSWGTRIITGAPVTDPELLGQLNLSDGEIAVEAPESLWEQ